MRRSLLALVTVVTAAAFAAPADAKPFTFKDAKGDQPASAGLDIVGVTYATEGVVTTSRVRGRTVKTYEPTKLVVTMTMAGAPAQEPGVKYRVTSQVESCGDMTFTYTNGAGTGTLSFSQMSVGCGGPAGTTGGDTLFLDPKFGVKGNKLIWSVPLKALPKNARKGALLYNFRAGVDATDPAFGILGPDDFGDAVFDNARSDDDWEIS